MEKTRAMLGSRAGRKRRSPPEAARERVRGRASASTSKSPGLTAFPGHRHSHRVNERRRLHTSRVGNRAQRRLDRRRIERLAARQTPRRAPRDVRRRHRCSKMLRDRRLVVLDRIREKESAERRRSRRAASRAASAARARRRTRRAVRREDRRARCRRLETSGCTRCASSSGASRMMCCWLNQSSFSGLKTALPPLMPSSEKRCDQLVTREQLAIAAAGRPAEQREKIDHRLRQIALLARTPSPTSRRDACSAASCRDRESAARARTAAPPRRARDTAGSASACSRCDRRRAPRA